MTSTFLQRIEKQLPVENIIMAMTDSKKQSKNKDSFIELLWEDILFTKILPYLPLKELFILRGLSSEYKLLINAYLKEMKQIHLGPYCSIFSVDAFKVLSENCTQLRELIAPNCSWLTDDLIVPVFENNENLSKIVLSQCCGLTSVCLQPVIINCQRLRCLCLAGCQWLTVGCLQSITLHQHNLVEVDFSACLMVDKLETINNFLIISHKIRVLNMSKLTCVNDTTLSVLSRSAKELETLNICDCHRVTSYGIRLILEYCARLKGLMCVGCPLVSSQSLKTPQRKNILIIPAPTNLAGGCRILLPRVNV